MKKFCAFLGLVALMSCQKEETPAPAVVVPTCKIASETGVNNAYKLEYTYDASGLISTLNVSVKDNATGQLKPAATIKYSYTNGRLSKIVDGAVEEILEYNSNGTLSKLSITKTNETAYLGYNLTFETDANGRISKVTDNKGLQTTLKRDTQGNILESVTLNTTTNKELHKLILSGYDGKASLFDAYQGWPFNVLGYYADYIKYPLFTSSAGGNATKRTEYVDGKGSTEVTYTYTYNTKGFPLTEQSLTKFLDGSGIATYSKTFTYTGCQ